MSKAELKISECDGNRLGPSTRDAPPKPNEGITTCLRAKMSRRLESGKIYTEPEPVSLYQFHSVITVDTEILKRERRR